MGSSPALVTASVPLAALLCVAAAAAQTPVATPETVALTGGTLIDGRDGPAVSDAVVVLSAGRIVCAGRRTACRPPAGARELDMRGRWILPGLIDAHVHYSQTGWADGRPDALDMRERFPYENTVATLKDPSPFYQANLCSGVTATFDVGGYPWTWSLRDEAERSPTSPHVAAAGPLLSTRDHWINMPAERQFIYMGSDSATRAGARYLTANGTDAIKIWLLVGAASPDTATWLERLQAAAEEAERAEVPLIVHATGLWQAKHALRAGARLLVHGVTDLPVDDEFLQLALRKGTVYTPTLVVGDGYRQLRARRFDAEAYELECVDPATRAKAFLTDSLPGRPADAEVARMEAAARRGFELQADNVRRIHAAGIPVAMGTDAGNPLTLHGPSVYLEMEALAAAGLSPMDVIVSATRVGARAMGRERDLGTIEATKIADLVIVDADPLADIRNLRRVTHVIRAGVVYERASLTFRPQADR